MTKPRKSNLTTGVLKALSIFGGVEMIKIICSIVRSKLIAVWIGSIGVGLFGIYNTAIDLLNVIFQLGIRDSAVRDIAASKKSSNYRTIIIVRRWALFLGLIGFIATIALSPALSIISFDNTSHSMAFIVIAFIIFLSSIQNGELAILQGSQQLGRLAKSSMWGVFIGVAISIPMFYFLGVDSVLPALVVYSLATTLATLSQRVDIPKPTPSVTLKETYSKGRGFITLGIYLTISAIVTNLVAFLFMAYLNKVGDTNTVGIYNAAYVIINKYVGVIFIAIAMEYYPRLSQVINSPQRTSTFVSHEMSIALWVLLPIIAIFIAASSIIIPLLYSQEFIVAIPFVIWAIIGTIFRAISWCMAFVILARGDGKTFLFTESASAITSITLNIIAYKHWGLEGLGIAYTLWYIIYAVIVACVYYFRYKLHLGNKMYRLISLVIILALSSTIGYKYVGWYVPAIIASISLPLSIKHLLKGVRYSKRTKQQANSCH